MDLLTAGLCSPQRRQQPADHARLPDAALLLLGLATPTIGSHARAAAAIDAIEAALPFPRKDPRPVWRGTAGFYGAHNPDLRADLLKVAGGAAWADVQELRGTAPTL